MPPLIRFLFIDAVWTGDGPRGLPRHRAAAGGRRLLGLRRATALALLHVRPLPAATSAGGSTSFFVLLRRRRRLAAVAARAASSDLGALSTSSSSSRSSALLPARRRAVLGLAASSTPTLWGGLLVTLVVLRRRHRGLAAARHPAGARPALDACRSCGCFCVVFIEFVRGVPLITVLFMATVMLPLFLPAGLAARQAAARADRRRAVLRRLHGRGGARRPAGDPARPVRRRRGARPRLLADDAADHPAAGAEARRSPASSTPSSACSRTRRWCRSSASSTCCGHRGAAAPTRTGRRPTTRVDRLRLRRAVLFRLLLRHVALFASCMERAARHRPTSAEGEHR